MINISANMFYFKDLLIFRCTDSYHQLVSEGLNILQLHHTVLKATQYTKRDTETWHQKTKGFKKT